jgi:hypothetical protein
VSGEAAAPCQHFDRQGLLLQERGLTDPHLATCPECQQRSAGTDALRRQLRELPIIAASTNWEQGVWDRIDGGRRARGRRRGWWAVLPVLVGAVAVVLLVRSRPSLHDETPGPTALALAFESPADRVRGAGGIAVGATLVMTASALRQPYAEFRLYRDGSGLLIRCAEQPPCERRGASLRGRFKLPAIGRYRLVLVVAPAPASPPAGIYDRDLAALTVTGATYLERSFEVW